MAEETNLFGVAYNKPEKIIYMPTQTEIGQLDTYYSYHYTVDELKAKAYEMRATLQKYKLVAIDRNGKKYTPASIALMFGSGKKLKKDYVAFIIIMGHPNNFHIFYDEWAEPIKQLFEKALKEHYVYHEEATRILGEPSVAKTKDYFWVSEVPNDKIKDIYRVTKAKAPVSRSKIYDQRDCYLELSSDIKRSMLLPLLFPGIDKIEKCEKLPNAEEYKTYSGEDNIFTVFPILNSMYDNGQLNMSRLKLPVGELKKATKLINLPEFFNDGNKHFSNVCASMVLNIFTAYCEESYEEADEIQDMLKGLLENIDDISQYLLPTLMPHFTGFRKTLVEYCGCGSIVESILNVLKKTHVCGWLPVEKITYHCRVANEYSEGNFIMFYTNDLDKVQLHNDYDGNDIYLSNILHELTRPYIKAVMFMLSAFGFVEIAYREQPAANATSYYDGLEYVRLTNLGLYALGIKRKYEHTAKQDVKYFELDTQRLIIKSLTDANPYESLLGNMATQISKRMYKVDYETFLAGCENQHEINAKINFFKNYVCDAPPANWLQFFESIKKRCKPMKAPQKKYALLQIPADDKELQRIILSDPIIRKYTLKAEGFILLVEITNKSKVEDALKKYGYLL